MSSGHGQTFIYIVPGDDRGKRLDVFLAALHADLSRSQIKRAIEEAAVTVNGAFVKAGHCLRDKDRVCFRREPPRKWAVEAENIPLSVVFEDDSIIVIDKPPGMVVHPGAGNYSGTLVNALLFHCPDLSGIGGYLRPGIVHRLDKDTSGLIVAAKNDAAHHSLARQFKDRTVTKTYRAVVAGTLPASEGVIEAPVGRHRTDRKKMSTSGIRGRQALTRWKVVKSFGGAASLLEVRIETGRTHQIRVHLNDMGHPVLGDRVYGKGATGIASARHGELRRALKEMNRQALHANALGFRHPLRDEFMEFTSPVAPDIARLLEELELITKGKNHHVQC